MIASLLRRCALAIALLFVTGFVAEAIAQPVPRPVRRGRRYRVRIDSAPQRAAIYLDDEKYGIFAYTPWEGLMVSGDYKLIIKLEGYEDATRVVRVNRSSRQQEFFLPLTKRDMPGELEVTADA